MTRFPTISLAILVALFVALQVSGHISRTYCGAFGFGGFGCSDPFVGWGDFMFATTIGLMLANVVQAIIATGFLVRWYFRLKRSRRKK
ncbi:hypothetical protein GTW25_10235 [Aliihoeflea aestuarii]|jgi:hypothetical protein|uniref:hypothetical protein n=1 Tax=Aliihoeflea aestuarii TaxID=453840 RepID=UPI002093F973|nr:hypothetical protein [Aliihoeflea aestuarii]MCO6391407.1 hypothetical protein [Aliihoeflea aestuarii]